MCLPIYAAGSGPDVEVGVISSPRSAGAGVSFAPRGNSRSVLRLYADVLDMLGGKHKSPGVKTDYHMMFSHAPIKVNDDTDLILSIGPGVALGYVSDTDFKHEFAAGVSCMASAALRFRRVPLTVSVDFSAMAGFRATQKNQFDQTLTLYKNGLRRCWIPELTIAYRF